MCRWFAIVVAALAAVASAPALAQMTDSQVAAAVAETYGVTVLRVVPVQENGRPAYRVTVMQGGGDVNGAYQVGTIVVDGATGRLVLQFRHRSSGYRLSGSPTYDGDISRPDAPQSGVVWR